MTKEGINWILRGKAMTITKRDMRTWRRAMTIWLLLLETQTLERVRCSMPSLVSVNTLETGLERRSPVPRDLLNIWENDTN